MGEVLLAEDAVLERPVAIKFLPDWLRCDPRARERFAREARSAAALDHPFICKIYELADIDGQPCIVMEYVAGDTLEQCLRQGVPPRPRAFAVGLEIAEALGAAHARRIVHRDLKPANIMITPQEHVKVMDFGLARRLGDGDASHDGHQTRSALTEAGVALGTPGYMSPEQALGRPVDERTDIFSYGIVLYQLLTGVHPFQKPNTAATLAALLHEAPPPVTWYAGDLGEGLALLIDRLLAKDPADRPRSFGDVLADLREWSSAVGTRIAVHRPVAESACGRRDHVLIGREREYRTLREHLQDATRGRGSLVVIQGEAGLGKTWLAEHVLGEARRVGCVTLIGRCQETEGAAPFLPFLEVLEQVCRTMPAAMLRDALGDAAPELARLLPQLRRFVRETPPPLDLPPEHQRRYLFGCVCDFFERASHVAPVVMLLDDLQWADDSTGGLLHALAERLPRMAVLVLATSRIADDDAEEGESPLARTLETLTRHHLADRLTLRGLSETDVRALLSALAGRMPPPALVRSIHEATGGHPFFVTEIFRHLEEDGGLTDQAGRWRTDVSIEELHVPHTIRQTIGHRLRHLDACTRAVLAAAAIIGRRFEPDLLDMLGEFSADEVRRALEAAERARLIVAPSGGRDTRWSFAMPLIRQTLEGDLSCLRRRRLHGRVFEAMERLYGEDVARRASEMAHHLYHAGHAADSAKTLRYLMLAGDAAWSVHAHSETVRQYRRALETLEDVRPPDQAERARLVERLGDVLGRSGNRSAALESYETLLAMSEAAADRGARARVHRKIGSLHWEAGQVQQAVASYRAGLALLEAEPDHVERAHLYQEMGRVAFRTGDTHGALEWARRALSHAEPLAARTDLDPPELQRQAIAAVSQACNTIGVALARQGRTADALAHIERSVAVAREHDLLDVACRGYANLGVLCGSIDPPRAIEVSHAGLDIAKKIGALGLQSHLQANLASAYCALTNRCEHEGMEAARAAIELDRQLGQLDHLAVPLIVLAQIHQCHGELPLALSCYREALELAESIGDPQLRVPCYDGLAMVHLDRGDTAQAKVYMEKARQLCEQTGIDSDSLIVLPFLC